MAKRSGEEESPGDDEVRFDIEEARLAWARFVEERRVRRRYRRRILVLGVASGVVSALLGAWYGYTEDSLLEGVSMAFGAFVALMFFSFVIMISLFDR